MNLYFYFFYILLIVLYYLLKLFPFLVNLVNLELTALLQGIILFILNA